MKSKNEKENILKEGMKYKYVFNVANKICIIDKTTTVSMILLLVCI